MTVGQPRRLRVSYVDALRALCALYVVVQHTWLSARSHSILHGDPMGPVAANLTGWMSFGYYAVTAFIVISGFSLALSMRTMNFTRMRDLAAYLARRARRLIPPYWAALVFAVVVGTVVVSSPTQTLWDIVLPIKPRSVAVQALLSQDFFHVQLSNYAFWSIAVEWHIYFAFPVLALLFRRFGAVTATLAALAAGVLFDFIARGTYAGAYLPAYLGYFAVGMFAVDAVRAGRWRRVPWLPLGVALLVALALIQTKLGYIRASQERHHLEPFVAFATAFILIGLGQRAARTADREPTRVSRWLAALGTFSYSLYLVHAPLLAMEWKYIYAHLGLGPVATLLLSQTAGLAAIVGISWVFYRLIERPCLPRSTRRAHERERRGEVTGMAGSVTQAPAASVLI